MNSNCWLGLTKQCISHKHKTSLFKWIYILISKCHWFHSSFSSLSGFSNTLIATQNSGSRAGDNDMHFWKLTFYKRITPIPCHPYIWHWSVRNDYSTHSYQQSRIHLYILHIQLILELTLYSTSFWCKQLTNLPTQTYSSTFKHSYSLQQHCPIELSTMMGMIYICVVQDGGN